MSQDDEIWIAFREAIRRDDAGDYSVSTRDFVTALQHHNVPHSLRAANQWIEIHISTFRDISVETGECRLFQVPAVRR